MCPYIHTLTWLLHSSHPFFYSDPRAWGIGVKYICFICIWTFCNLLFSIQWPVVDFYGSLHVLQKVSSQVRDKSCIFPEVRSHFNFISICQHNSCTITLVSRIWLATVFALIVMPGTGFIFWSVSYSTRMSLATLLMLKLLLNQWACLTNHVLVNLPTFITECGSMITVFLL